MKKKRIVIPQLSTKLPMSLMDMMLCSNIATSIWEKTGQLDLAYNVGAPVMMGIFGVYVFSWSANVFQKKRSSKINFKKYYGVNPRKLEEMPNEERKKEVKNLTELINDEYVPQKYEQKELAALVDKELTKYIANITGVEVVTGSKIRKYSLFNFLVILGAKGACEPGGEVFIFGDQGVLEPHTIAHEFTHRKGYFKELEAQALAYLSLISSEDAVLKQAARCSRLEANISVLTDTYRKENTYFYDVRLELKKYFAQQRSGATLVSQIITAPLRIPFLIMYHIRMKLTGQKGLSDYRLGFTNFLYAIDEPVK